MALTVTLLCVMVLSISVLWGGGKSLLTFSLQATLPLRGLLAILIIADHFGNVFGDQWPFTSGWCWWGGTSVACFFFMSGYGLAVSYLKAPVAYLSTFFSKRFSRLLPPFVLLTVVAIGLRIWLLHESGTDILSGFIHGHPPLWTSWFIFALLYYYVAFYLSCRLMRQPLRAGIMLVALTLLYMICVRRLGWGGYWYSSIMAANVGYFVAVYSRAVDKAISQKARLVLPLLAVSLIVAALAAAYRREYFQPLLTLALPAVVYAVIVTRHVRWPRLLVWIGGFSYEVYLAQGLLAGLIPYLTPAVAVVLFPVGSVMLAYLLHRFDGMPFLRRLRA